MVNKEQQNFLKAFSALIDNEGGYVNDPNDRGGETKFGISKKQYPELNIKDLTLDKAKDIYYTDYWLRAHCNEMHYALAFEVFDAAVNHGQTKAIMLLQEALDVADDGKIGPVTRAKLASMNLNDLLLRYSAYRLKFFTKLTTWDHHGRGWARRIADNLIRASNTNDD